MPAREERVDFSDRELATLRAAAEKLGLTVEETVQLLAKQELAKRANRPVRVSPAQVIPFAKRKL